MNNFSVPAIELFQNRGLLIFGSAGVAWYTTTHEVALLLAEKLLVEDPTTGHAKPIGTLWKEIYNEIKGSYSIEPQVLSQYGILGDPMLFVRGVYDSATAVDENFVKPLVCQSSPNPFNGQIQFQISGLEAGGGNIPSKPNSV